ncbi:MAG: hypothetical protein JSW60_06680 [Thermoplasmatales archaeon]|nr:MAG: hypothetical protein JSW60_06680 [Thermoplasmatales archaeon]
MKIKILGIFVCMLLIAVAVLPATGTLDEKTMTSTGGIESVPILDFVNIKGGILGISVVLMNFGEGTAHDIIWSMNVSGGLYNNPIIKNLFLLFGGILFRNIDGKIDSLEPGEEKMISIKPMLGLGRFTVYFNCKYIIRNLSRCDVDVEVKHEWIDQGLLFLHDFPPILQPEEEWRNITNSTYIGGGMVKLNYTGPPIGIYQLHNVRVFDPVSEKTEFLGACSFTNGTGTIKECHVTYDIVEFGGAYWQVELVNGE